MNAKTPTVRVVRPAIVAVLLLLATGCTPASIALKQRETMLKEVLQLLRKQIDQYTSDQLALPPSLQDLVSKAYLREAPIDPITGNQDWKADMGESVVGGVKRRGIIDVHSNAPGKSCDGISYRDY